MSAKSISARYQVKDSKGASATDSEGKLIWLEGSVSYDFGDNVPEAVEKFGADVVFYNFTVGAKLCVQNVIRAKLKAGLSPEAIQEFLDSYTIGMPLERTKVNPEDATRAAFHTWSPEKQREFLLQLGVSVD